MQNTKIKVPKYLQELHGEYPDIFTLIITYLAGIISGILVIVFTDNVGLPVWKSILLFVLYADIAGGVISNFSSSTKDYYQTNKKLRLPFILMHLIHPALFILVFPDFAGYFIYVGLYTILACLILARINQIEIQLTTALLLLLLGTSFSFCFKIPVNFLFSFAPLFMTKLIIGFSVDRPNFEN
jgi:hypothetical protein